MTKIIVALIVLLSQTFYVYASFETINKSVSNNFFSQDVQILDSNQTNPIQSYETASLLNNNNAILGSSESQIIFYAGYACGGRMCTLNYLKVTGTNQYNMVVRWEQNIRQEFSVPIYNWWWKPDKGISFQFVINGYSGWRGCNIMLRKPFWGFPSVLKVTYTGNNTCSVSS